MLTHAACHKPAPPPLDPSAHSNRQPAWQASWTTRQRSSIAPVARSSRHGTPHGRGDLATHGAGAPRFQRSAIDRRHFDRSDLSFGRALTACRAGIPSGLDAKQDFDGRYGSGSSQLIPEEVLADLDTEERSTVGLFQRASISVVNISTSSAVLSLFPLNIQSIPRGVGSGFIWDTQGHVVTNAHVVAGASEVRCTLSDQTTCKAKVRG